MSIESLRNSVRGETKLVWVLLKCANYVEENEEAASEVGCLWYDHDHILLNYHIFARFIGKTIAESIRSYLHSHRFIRDKSKETIRANVPEKFNFSTFEDPKNWGICKCDGFNKDTTEEEAWQSNYDKNFRTRENRQNKASITNQTNFYSFQNSSAVATYRPMNNFNLQIGRQSQININQAIHPSNFAFFKQRAPQRNLLPTPQIARIQTIITPFTPNNQQFNGLFRGLNAQYPNVNVSSSNFANFYQGTPQRSPLPTPQIAKIQAPISPFTPNNQQSNEPSRDLTEQLPNRDQENNESPLSSQENGENPFDFLENPDSNTPSDEFFNPLGNFFIDW